MPIPAPKFWYGVTLLLEAIAVLLLVLPSHIGGSTPTDTALAFGFAGVGTIAFGALVA